MVTSPMVKIQQIFTGNHLRNFNYLLQGGGGDIFAIDPYNAMQLSPLIESWGGNLGIIINTHEHADHTMGNTGLVEAFGAKVYAHTNARGKIARVDRFLKKGDRIALDRDHTLHIMDTPGHTHAHLCLLLMVGERPHAVFTGDTLFNAGVGNCHNGGDPVVLYKTIKEQFMTLPDNVLVYPGHEYLGNNLGFTLRYWPSNKKAQQMQDDYRSVDPDKVFFVTNMGEEKEINTFLRLNEGVMIDNLEGNPVGEKQVFLTLRSLRDRW